METQELTNNKLEWYVMRCRRIDAIAESIKKFNERAKDLQRVDDVFVPAERFQNTKNVTRRPEEIRMGNTLRRFVFLKIRPEGLEALSKEQWQDNRDYHLYHYRDHEGNKLTTTDSMMTRFKTACEEYGSKFEIITLSSAPAEIAEGITVRVREGAFKDVDAEVVHVHNTGKEILLTVAVKVFGDTYARINDLKVDDVVISADDSPVFNLRFIDEVEAFLLETLRQKVSKKGFRLDSERLKDYYRLSDATFADEAVRDRFDALMLMCASLLQHTAGKKRYNRRLKLRIKELRESQGSGSSLASIAWLLTALFVSTRDADFRTELKSLIPSINPRPDSICHFLSVIRQL